MEGPWKASYEHQCRKHPNQKHQFAVMAASSQVVVAALDGLHAASKRRVVGLTTYVISTTEVFLQPYVCDYKKVATSHFLDLEFRAPAAAVPPGYRNHPPRISPHDRFQRQLDRKIKMRRKKGARALHHGSPICLEGVRCIVERDPEQEANKEICQTIDP